jgi:hypothetical protein
MFGVLKSAVVGVLQGARAVVSAEPHPHQAVILSGETRAGKTCTGLYLIDALQARGVAADKIAVLTNDADRSQLAADRDIYGGKGVHVVGVDTGCACCEQASPFNDEVRRLLDSGYEYLIVELSGTASHYAVSELLKSQPMLDKEPIILYHASALSPRPVSQGDVLAERDRLQTADFVILTKVSEDTGRAANTVQYYGGMRSRAPDAVLTTPLLFQPNADIAAPALPFSEQLFSPSPSGRVKIAPPTSDLRRQEPADTIGLEIYPGCTPDDVLKAVRALYSNECQLIACKGFILHGGKGYELNLSEEHLNGARTDVPLTEVPAGSWDMLNGASAIILRSREGIINPQLLTSIGIPHCDGPQLERITTLYRNSTLRAWELPSADYLLPQLRALESRLETIPESHRQQVVDATLTMIREYSHYRLRAFNHLASNFSGAEGVLVKLYLAIPLCEMLAQYGAPPGRGKNVFQEALNSTPTGESRSLRDLMIIARPATAWIEATEACTQATHWHGYFSPEKVGYAVNLLINMGMRAVKGENISKDRVRSCLEKTFSFMDERGNRSFTAEMRAHILSHFT